MDDWQVDRMRNNNKQEVALRTNMVSTTWIKRAIRICIRVVKY